MTFATTKSVGADVAPSAAINPQQLTRAERETRAIAALVKKQAFEPGIFGFEREQQALMIVRVVLDAIE